jgi:hypothetical protein
MVDNISLLTLPVLILDTIHKSGRMSYKYVLIYIQPVLWFSILNFTKCNDDMNTEQTGIQMVWKSENVWVLNQFKLQCQKTRHKQV